MAITKKELEHLANLARIELGAEEEEKLLKDLEGILGYVEELKSLDASDIEPVAGGTTLINAFREDDERENTDRGKGVEAFPKTKDGFLKIPPVFE